jgi:ribulose-5-phosphate 4-epimerase/fuculose-1-phosphate aldolase
LIHYITLILQKKAIYVFTKSVGKIYRENTLKIHSGVHKSFIDCGDFIYMNSKIDVLTIANRIYSNRLAVASLGNVSCRENEESIAITPSGLDYEDLTVEDMVTITYQGEVLEGIHPPSSETPMHTLIYRERPDVNGVVHTHSLYASAFSVVNKEIPVNMVEVAAHVGGSVLVAPYRLPGTEDLGQQALSVLQERRACILQNHGVLAIGDTLEKAYKAAVIVEIAAQIHILGSLIGTPSEIPMEDIQKLKSMYFS